MADQWDHDFGIDLAPGLWHRSGSLEDGASLHDVDLREEQAQAAAAQAEHGVHLTHARYSLQQFFLLGQFLLVSAQRLQARDIDEQFLIGRQELVQRRGEQAKESGGALSRLVGYQCLEEDLETRALGKEGGGHGEPAPSEVLL